MRFLLIFPGALVAAAKQYATPLRHRRNTVYLRELEMVQAHPEVEACDGLISMVLNPDDPIPSVIRTLWPLMDVLKICPGDSLSEPSELERMKMNPLNLLRHDAALLGIEVDPAFDEVRLAALIADRQGAARVENEADELEARRLTEAAEVARIARETQPDPELEATRLAMLEEAARIDRERLLTSGAAGGNTSHGEADPGTPGGEGDNKPHPFLDEHALTPPSDPLAGIDTSDALALRAFAVARNIPHSPNRRTSADKLLASIRLSLGV